MLKKIPVDQLTLGMYLHGLCGSWIDHPFWKSRFELRDPRDLAKLRESSVTEVWIDVEKGADVARPDAQEQGAGAPAEGVIETPPEALPETAPEVDQRESRTRREPEPATSMQEELGRAAALVNASRERVQALFLEARMGKALDAEGCMPLVEDIASSVWRNQGALVSLARLKNHDDYSYMHSVAVCALMVSLARQLGRDESESHAIGLAGLLHDLGKAMMPLDVLNKPGELTPGEFDIIKSHPQLGHDMLSVGGQVPDIALDVCLHHHERPDGKGYPFGLSGDALSIHARMGAVCDVYDAITSNRAYKQGWDPAHSLSSMSSWTKDGQFDPAVFAAFVKSLGVYPVGSLVRMRSGRLAVVTEQSATQLLRPWVKVFYSTKSQMPVAVEVLDTSDPRCTDQIVARESNATWKFKYLDELWAGREVLAGLVPKA